MIIKSVEISDYRNYKNATLELSPLTTVFYGQNGHGKTSALEAIYYCGLGHSYKGTNDSDIIRFGAQEAHLKLIAEQDGIPHRIDVHLKKGARKGIAIDGIILKRAVELLGFMHVVLFSPEDMAIVKSSPQERRNFLDTELCQLDKIYTTNLINYNHLLGQKNKLLKQIEDNPSLADTLSVWNEQLISYGTPIIEKRAAFIKELSEIMKPIHSSITGGTEDIDIIYDPSSEAGEYRSRVLSHEKAEIASHTSLIGPHRDDMQFLINGIDVRKFGSQGQQRTAALSLKLAEIELVKKKTGQLPILLLDDVLSELDEGRQKRLLDSISGIQTVITCTGLDDFVLHSFHINKTFLIEDGQVVCEDKGKG
ncbi:MAG: DNA replication/repair protein RecF [Lachnospiraceae bacterium]|nr:DNA replication/repair protein RecF [Candidatus Minthocola equi]